MTDKELIQQFLESLRDDVIKNIKPVSGQTANSFEVVVRQDGGDLLAASYIQTLEDGRPPTKPGAHKGSPTLQQKIYAWILQIGLGTSAKNQLSVSWAMATKIHKEGNRLYRSGGKSGVLSNVFTKERIDAFAETFFGRYEAFIIGSTIKSFQA